MFHASGVQVWNFDQKPFHMNESGSKDIKTLDFANAREVAIKEVHSQTRARWTVCTLCQSSLQRDQPPPFECMFKGGEQILRSCEDCIANDRACQEVRMTAAVSNSGSYRLEHVLAWLERVLAPAGRDGRWRILMCDAYRAHFGEALLRLAWQHRFVVIFVGGGATGVVQVNDTHLHGPLSKAYIELESADMFGKLQLNPSGCPVRSRGDCLRDVAVIWQRLALHRRSSAGFKANQLTNALDGSEDHLASSEVRAFWDELGMSEVRERCVRELCSDWQSGTLDWSFEVVYGQVEAFPLTGHLDYYEEGQEDEGEDPGGAAWDDADGPSPAGSDAGEPSLPRGSDRDTLTDAQAVEVKRVEDRLAALDRAAAAAEGETAVARAIAQAIPKQEHFSYVPCLAPPQTPISRCLRFGDILRLAVIISSVKRTRSFAICHPKPIRN